MTCVCAGAGREFKHLAESESFWAQCRCRMAIKRKVLFVSRLLVSSSSCFFFHLLLVGGVVVVEAFHSVPSCFL